MKCVILVVLVSLLTGCCSWCPDKITTVYVPTQCKPPAIVSDPSLKTILLTDSSTSKDVIQAYVLDVEDLKDYVIRLKAALKPYEACKGQ